MKKFCILIVAMAFLATFTCLVGCKKAPAYVGSYVMQVDPQAIAEAKQFADKIGHGATVNTKKMEEEAAKNTLTLKADGTFEQTYENQTIKGKYTFANDTVSLEPEGSSQGQKLGLLFNESEGTLSITMGGEKTVFKKKKA